MSEESHASVANVLRRKLIAAMPRARLEALHDAQDRPWHWERKELDRRTYERWDSFGDEVKEWVLNHC